MYGLSEGMAEYVWSVCRYDRLCLVCLQVWESLSGLYVGMAEYVWSVCRHGRVCLVCMQVWQSLSGQYAGMAECVWSVCSFVRLCLVGMQVWQSMSGQYAGMAESVWSVWQGSWTDQTDLLWAGDPFTAPTECIHIPRSISAHHSTNIFSLQVMAGLAAKQSQKRIQPGHRNRTETSKFFFPDCFPTRDSVVWK